MPEPEVPAPHGQPSRKALRLAGVLAEELFQNAEGEKAHRLVLLSADGEELGRWDRTALRAFAATLIDRGAGAPDATS